MCSVVKEHLWKANHANTMQDLSKLKAYFLSSLRLLFYSFLSALFVKQVKIKTRLETKTLFQHYKTFLDLFLFRTFNLFKLEKDLTLFMRTLLFY